jgi:hypothetical protein
LVRITDSILDRFDDSGASILGEDSLARFLMPLGADVGAIVGGDDGDQSSAGASSDAADPASEAAGPGLATPNPFLTSYEGVSDICFTVEEHTHKDVLGVQGMLVHPDFTDGREATELLRIPPLLCLSVH